MTAMQKSAIPDVPRPPRIGFFGELGSGNWGNDAGLDVITALIERHWPEAQFGFMTMGTPPIATRCDWPVVPLQWYEGYSDQIRAVPRRVRQVLGRVFDVVRILRWPRHYDLVIIPGAGVLEDTTPVRPWGTPMNLLLLGIGTRLARTKLAYVAVGASVPPPGLSRRMFTWAARLADYRSYRDSHSHGAARQLGIGVARDHVFTDLAFALETPVPTESESIGSPPAPRVAIGVMNYQGRAENRSRASELHERYVRQVGRIVGHLVQLGWCIVLVTGDREDRPVAHRIRDAVLQSHPSASIEDATVASMDDLMRVLSRSRCVIASRFHNLLGALFMSVPTISLSYAAKNDAVMERMGLGEFCQRIDAIDEELLLEQFQRLEARHDVLSAAIAARCAHERRVVDGQLDDLLELITRVLDPGHRDVNTSPHA
jgi:polysaccharide pyruvyl transferase WcaK-like protein